MPMFYACNVFFPKTKRLYFIKIYISENHNKSFYGYNRKNTTFISLFMPVTIKTFVFHYFFCKYNLFHSTFPKNNFQIFFIRFPYKDNYYQR